MNLVKRAVVARFLKVSSNNLGHWVKAGEIQEVECGLLTVPAINEFLCRCARGFGNNPPTWDDIRSGRLVFLHYSEMERFGFSIQQLRLLRKSEKLQYLKFPGLRGESRYLEASVAKHTNRTASGYSVLQTRHILGRSQETIFALIRAKKLQYAPKTIGVREKTICQDSLIALLRDLLPPWVDPLDWVDDRLECQEPLVALHETAARLGISERQAPRYLHEHRAWFIKASDGSNIRTSPFWLDAIDETAKPLRLRHIAQLYGQSLNAASFWRLAGLINCPIINHDHSNSPLLFRQCWIALLLANCSPGFEPHIPYFLNRQFGAKPIEMIGIMEVKKVLSASYETVNRLALEGKIWAIKSPEGRWRFPRPYIERSKKLLKG